ncbi:MAG: hopanoid biosynthesis-associated protein HpnK [Caulobacteraceae bacterium]|nr:hopanoid biosynthesis-associated protein HpnK [Caulobacter sp.]
MSPARGAQARLIVTADDFGASPQVNEAVEHAFSHGILRAASLMVAAPGRDDAVARARRLHGLRVGLHLVLVEGRALLPHADLPDLTTPDGFFRRDMAAAAVDIFFRPAARRQLLAEVRAQFAAFAATGLPLDHVNTHKHFHLHPTIAGAILKVGAEHGLAASRAPVEPLSVLRAVDAAATPRSAWLTDPWARLVRARFRARGVEVADQVFGLAWSGAMTPTRVAGLIRALPPGLSELYTHPATSGGWEGEAPDYRYAEELEALTAPDVLAAVRERGAVLGGFTDFA